MCAYPEPVLRCRSRQLFDAAERIIDEARLASKLTVSQQFSDLAALQSALKNLAEHVATFDRLNRGL